MRTPSRSTFPLFYSPRGDLRLGVVKPTDVRADGSCIAERTKQKRILHLYSKACLALASQYAPRESNYFEERIEIIYTTPDRMVPRDPELFVRSQGFRQEINFLLKTIDCHTLKIFEKFLRMAENIDAHAARRAVEEVYLSEGTD
ncbi:hypothetical protein V5O48_015220 [Marasmius crinis-equi]|uniref:Uncharacterized protein n=1 Tax=Marasmius crinis-equi TaxID=585013 RepID=A0ABR3EV51_9AGAR